LNPVFKLKNSESPTLNRLNKDKIFDPSHVHLYSRRMNFLKTPGIIFVSLCGLNAFATNPATLSLQCQAVDYTTPALSQNWSQKLMPTNVKQASLKLATILDTKFEVFGIHVEAGSMNSDTSNVAAETLVLNLRITDLASGVNMETTPYDSATAALTVRNKTKKTDVTVSCSIQQH
jgi:hypothetical protein